MGEKKRNNEHSNALRSNRRPVPDPTSSTVWLVSATKVGVHAITRNVTELSGLIKFDNTESVNFSVLENEYFMPTVTAVDTNFNISSIAGIRRTPRSDPDKVFTVGLIVGIIHSNGALNESRASGVLRRGVRNIMIQNTLQLRLSPGDSVYIRVTYDGSPVRSPQLVGGSLLIYSF